MTENFDTKGKFLLAQQEAQRISSAIMNGEKQLDQMRARLNYLAGQLDLLSQLDSELASGQIIQTSQPEVS